MSQSAYPRFCPIAMAADLIEPRWTLLVLCEMFSGSTRFSEIQRGVPAMSPGLLSKRLKDMQGNGLVERRENVAGGHAQYHLTELAVSLGPVIYKLGEWAHQNIDSEVSLKYLDARMLMWNIRHKINRDTLPVPRCVIQFTLKNPPDEVANYWLVIKPGLDPDICYVDPGHSVDLFVVSELRALTSAWMGHSRFEDEIAAERITLIGHIDLARSLTKWMVRSCYADASAPGVSA
ncbi:winged helix-turn-helix transcriptional regulator [Halocynthiibacter sp.]|uniref:winged helix-turn-helix transcriptional regulator n=1 Tax=Halocynthiibacter sp. TaxID=1979210 RepID=UPI003C6399A0